ncbi:MAG: hypothetical protein WD317_05880, partial [Balneolaceae bacterium]
MGGSNHSTRGDNVRSFWIGLLWFLFVAALLGLQNPEAVYGQTTPGLIYKPAEGNGQLILNPNGHGFASETTAGFTWSDVEESEIPYHPLPQFEVEQIGDVRTGASGGHTDLADNGQKQTAFMYYDGENLLFRVRLGGQSTSSKGYSFFFNTAFETFGPKGGNFSSVNPGFQFEIVLETGNGVQIYELDGESPILRQTLGLSQHHQRAISYTHLDGSTGFFYDFYVPVSEIESAIPGFTFNSSTDFRAAAATITRSQSGITGTLSDINGINDSNYSNTVQALTDITESTQSVNLNDIGEEGSGFGDIVQQTRIPSISSPILNGADTVSGFINEEDGATVQVYRDGSYWTTADPSSSYAWTATADALATDEVITARAQFGSKDWSEFSSGVTVTEAGENIMPCLAVGRSTIGALGIHGGSGNIQSIGSSNMPGLDAVITEYGTAGVGIRLVEVGGTTAVDIVDKKGAANGSVAEYLFSGTDLVNEGGDNWTLTTAGGKNGLPGDVSYEAILYQDSDPFCIGARSDIFGAISVTAAPVFNPDEYNEDDESVSGTVDASANLVALYKNGIQVGTTTHSGGSWSFDVTLVNGDELHAIAEFADGWSGQSSVITVTEGAEIPLEPSIPPVISGSYAAGSGITVSGTSTEPAGTVITVYLDGAEEETATVNSQGEWEREGVTLDEGDVITATAIAPGKDESEPSGSVSVLAAPPEAPTLDTDPLTTFDNSLSVSGAASTGYITIYVDDAAVAFFDAVNGTHTGISGSSGHLYLDEELSISVDDTDFIQDELYRGADVYVTSTPDGQAESVPSNAVTVTGVESFSIELA